MSAPKCLPALLLLTLSILSVRGQQHVNLELLKAESELDGLFFSFYTDTVADRDSLMAEILPRMERALSLEDAMTYPYNRLNRVGKVRSDDGALRIFSWHYETSPGSYRYYGFIQVAQKRGKLKLFRLYDNEKPQRNTFQVNQSPKDWYGKLYYQLVAHRYKRKTYYTLLGMDFNDRLSNIKTVEVLSLQRQQPRFLKGRLSKQGKKADRFVLEYTDNVAVSVRFDPELDLIVFDHLIPEDPGHPERLQTYGPDGSYDGLEFEKGYWIYRDDIDARNPH